MMPSNNRLSRTVPNNQIANEVYSLQLVIQEITDLLSDREQVIDSLHQEIQQLHEKMNHLERQQHQFQQASYRPSSSLFHQPYGGIDMRSSLPKRNYSLPSLDAHYQSSQQAFAQPTLPPDFFNELRSTIEQAVSQSFEQMIPILQNNEKSSSVPTVSEKKSIRMPVASSSKKSSPVQPVVKKKKSSQKEKTRSSSDASSTSKKKITSGLKKKTSEQHAFKFSDGRVARSIAELVHIIRQSPADLFTTHVYGNTNHFASWIHNVFKNETLATQISSIKNKTEFLELFK